MFVRKVFNKSSGKTYVQVVDKRSGDYSVVKSIGSSYYTEEIQELVLEGKNWINRKAGIQELDFANHRNQIEQYLNGIEHLNLVGLDLLLGKIFDDIGFNQVEDGVFKHLVLYRLAYPKSKLKTTEYLYRYQNIDWSEDQIYRYLDKLYNSQKELIQRISYEHTMAILGNKISLVFYDVTTLYFEIDDEDDLRKTGFSKEGKHQNPQIILGLLVSRNGYPLAYDIFEGNKFEGHTMLPVLNRFKKKFNLENLIVVADSGLLSNDNIENLKADNYEFIIGARIKKEEKKIKEHILALTLKDGESTTIKKKDLTLIITYSEARAKKDKHNREKGLRRLEKQVRRGKLTKSNINNRGYNKYLKLEGEIKVSVDQERFFEDAKWDGLKGYLTNAKLSKEEIIENYSHLWQIEKAFRVAKSELKIRPIYHRLQKRIEAHICLAFVAYKVYKELERQLELKKSTLKPAKAIEIAENIFEIHIKVPSTNDTIKKLLLLSDEQKQLAELFGFGC